ncbi:IS5 family transposase domain protein [Rickettsiales endosymbiont of Paramecium tredecaurelia]|nr:IS5 family transposase domain protein [Candidatus Sarmatiella mevalonica]
MVVQLKYEQVKILSDDQFRRLIGVKRGTFDKMVKILEEADKKKKTKGGRRNKLSMEKSAINGIGIYQRIPRIFPC